MTLSQPWLIGLATLAILIIAGLSFYAGKLLFLLKKQKMQQAQLLLEQAEKAQKRKDYQVSSIRTIAKAVAEEQCELSEAAIRICVLLDNSAAQTDAYISHYPKFYELYHGIKALPTHDDRKALKKKERASQDMYRWRLEAELKTELLAEAKKLSQFDVTLS